MKNVFSFMDLLNLHRLNTKISRTFHPCIRMVQRITSPFIASIRKPIQKHLHHLIKKFQNQIKCESNPNGCMAGIMANPIKPSMTRYNACPASRSPGSPWPRLTPSPMPCHPGRPNHRLPQVTPQGRRHGAESPGGRDTMPRRWSAPLQPNRYRTRPDRHV